MAIKRKILKFGDFKKSKNSLENAEKYPIKEGEGSNEYMFWQNLKTIKHACEELLEMDKDKVNALLANGHGWAIDHIATSADDVEEVYHFIEANKDSEDDDKVIYEKLSAEAKEFISKKIKTLMDEGRPQKQAIAMAYSYAKKEGYDVPANEAANNVEDVWNSMSPKQRENALDTFDISAPKWIDKEWKEVPKSIQSFFQEWSKKNESADNSFQYKMLSRLQSDCDYFLGHGNRSEKVLWAGSVDKQIEEMKRLWNLLPEKPEWLSMEEIEEYEKKMKESK